MASDFVSMLASKIDQIEEYEQAVGIHSEVELISEPQKFFLSSLLRSSIVSEEIKPRYLIEIEFLPVSGFLTMLEELKSLQHFEDPRKYAFKKYCDFYGINSWEFHPNVRKRLSIEEKVYLNQMILRDTIDKIIKDFSSIVFVFS